MKKIVCVLVLSGMALALSGFEKEDFDKIVDFSLDIKGISAAVQDPAFNPDGKRFVVFDGSVASVLYTDPDELGSLDDFMAEIEVAGGEWKGTEDVSLFRVVVYAFGPDFVERIHGENAVISRNARVLVAGVINNVYTDEADGKKYAVILAHHIRIIQ